ncbi:hypothetical protein VWH97_07355 [Escherichia coli O157]|nr:hypothetical protein [Escherichia coli O157]USL83654.1 structural protein [Escherichia phage A4]
MAYRMWKKGRTNDYKFIDSAIAEQYNIGGVDMWLYAFVGAKPSTTPNDYSYGGDYITDGSAASSIGDLIFGETSNRSYNLEAITLSCVYQVQEATPDLKIPGLFFNFNTMDITVHYNTMMQRLGRKIMPGDVIELPNLRDFDVVGKDSGLNRFYVVQDGFRTSEGYSATWQHHIYKIRVKPITDSPEYADLLTNNDYPDNPDDPNNGNGNSGSNGSSPNSSYDNEMDIMNRIIMQADDEVPYIHFTNEHIYDDRPDTTDLSKFVLNGYDFPEEPANKMYFLKKTLPVLKEKVNNSWENVSVPYGTTFPRKPSDGDFFYKENDSDVTGYSLYQYDKSLKKWLNCDVEYSTGDVPPKNAEDFYIQYEKPTMYQYLDGTWQVPPDTHVNLPFSSNSVYGNIDSQQDSRPKIPPARGTVQEGDTFPSDPTDGEYFYRTDYNPVTLWEYSEVKKSWVIFDYGGRKPWEGADLALTEFVNSPNRVPLHDAAKPNTLYRAKGDKE